MKIDETDRSQRLLEAQSPAAELFVAVREADILRPGVLDSAQPVPNHRRRSGESLRMLPDDIST